MRFALFLLAVVGAGLLGVVALVVAAWLLLAVAFPLAALYLLELAIETLSHLGVLP